MKHLTVIVVVLFLAVLLVLFAFAWTPFVLFALALVVLVARRWCIARSPFNLILIAGIFAPRAPPAS